MDDRTADLLISGRMGKKSTDSPPRGDDALLVDLAHAAKKRLEYAIDALEDDGDDDHELWRRLVRRTYHAAFGNERTLRWLTFVRALETETQQQLKDGASDAVVARRVIARYGRIFPELATKLDVAKLEAAVLAWRSDRNQWKAVHAALSDIYLKLKLPTPRSLATQWSRKMKRVPSVKSRKRRPPKRSRLR